MANTFNKNQHGNIMLEYRLLYTVWQPHVNIVWQNGLSRTQCGNSTL